MAPFKTRVGVRVQTTGGCLLMVLGSGFGVMTRARNGCLACMALDSNTMNLGSLLFCVVCTVLSAIKVAQSGFSSVIVILFIVVLFESKSVFK